MNYECEEFRIRNSVSYFEGLKKNENLFVCGGKNLLIAILSIAIYGYLFLA